MQESNLLSLSYGRIVRKDVNSNEGLLPESFETYQVVQGGDIVLRLTDLQNDKRSLRSAQVRERGIITSAYLAIQPKNALSEFLAYLLRAYDLTKVFYSMGGGLRQSMKFSDLKRMPIVVPPRSEQVAIVAFLDRETAKIDALIAEQEKLIALLEEKRQATISHAVTKGLNPHASMNDSGVAWLGKVPAHWTVGKIQSFAKRESGHTPSRQHPEYWENCTIPWFSLADVWQIRSAGAKYVTETKELVSKLGLANSSARLLPKGTVILSRTASVGYSAIMGVDMATTQDFVNWVCKPDLLPEFLLSVLRGMRTEFNRLMMGSTHQTIYMPDIAKLMMAKPPIEDQVEIVSFLDDVAGQLDELSSAAESGIKLLKERRRALIAAAVTGQIDVRGEVGEVAA
ncbi:restriction endonuclease subunit S [Xanthomonas campestris]|uniref:restriction endonuclease subunit S n=1 Tax=Xanthomonas campestris TaxID=339 RepID=UPI001CD3FDDE|nr:restriction endonuclease subunit S [Xanthomonas campestris]